MNEPIGTSKSLFVATTDAPGFWSRLARRVRSWFEFPYGYQDESGFHFGPQPAPQKILPLLPASLPVFTDRAHEAMVTAISVPSSLSSVDAKTGSQPAAATQSSNHPTILADNS